MSRRKKRKAAATHGDMLIPSNLDKRTLPMEIQPRFLDLCDLFYRLRGIELTPPAELVHDLVRWREVVLRHRAGDYRHKPSEWESTKAVAEWTAVLNAELRNQDKPVIEWRD